MRKLFAIIVILLCYNACNAAWFNNSWPYRVKLSTDIANATTSAVRGNGVDSRIDCGNDASLSPNYITMACRFMVKSFTTSDNSGIISKGDASNRRYWLWTKNAKTLDMQIDGVLRTNAVGTLIEDTTYYFVATYDGANTITYLNGVLKNTYAQATGTIDPDDDNLFIGYLNGFNYSNAIIDEIRLYNIGISSTQALALSTATSKNFQLGIEDTNLFAHYKFTERQGPYAFDSSSNTNTGTFKNMTWSEGLLPLDESDKTDETLIEFPMTLKITTITAVGLDILTNSKIDGTDIVFTASDGETQYAHKIISYSSSTFGLFRFNMNTFTYGDLNEIFCYYGNPGASDQQDQLNVFNDRYNGVYEFEDNGLESTGKASSGTITSGDFVSGTIGQAIQLTTGTFNISKSTALAFNAFEFTDEIPFGSIDAHNGVARELVGNTTFFHFSAEDFITKTTAAYTTIISTDPTVLTQNHTGDISIYDGKIYIPIYHLILAPISRSTPTITILNTSDYSLVERVDVSGDFNGGIDAITVDGENNRLYAVAFESATVIKEYQLDTVSFIRNISIFPPLDGLQGIAKKGDLFYLSINDGLSVYEYNFHASSITMNNVVFSGLGDTTEGLDYTFDDLLISYTAGAVEGAYFTEPKSFNGNNFSISFWLDSVLPSVAPNTMKFTRTDDAKNDIIYNNSNDFLEYRVDTVNLIETANDNRFHIGENVFPADSNKFITLNYNTDLEYAEISINGLIASALPKNQYGVTCDWSFNFGSESFPATGIVDDLKFANEKHSINWPRMEYESQLNPDTFWNFGEIEMVPSGQTIMGIEYKGYNTRGDMILK